MTFHTNKREPENEESSEAIQQPSRTTRLSGWAGIEEHAMKHDTGMMRDYADDIDTLLVFAALFSAILTTFVVQTYQLLKPADSSITNQLIAYQISSQGDRSDMPSAVNATISSLLAISSSSAPSLSARWINVLFFSSLVLSLAAALFGIMTKQWIREYMKWNAPLAMPRDNILIWQIRIENWEKWNVEACIWSIPSLLQLAMILFLTGVMILLWTLDSVVAIAITVLTSSFLGIVSVITILPLFIKHCPYRSPTAWALVRLWDVLGCYLHIGCVWVRKQFSNLDHWHVPYFSESSWRSRDAGGTWGADYWKNPSVEKSVHLELARENTHLTQGGSFVEEPDEDRISLETTGPFITELMMVNKLT